ncbi:MAG TPA: hypothetical protein ENK66_07215 [Arcobacter sp.]|jgi:hypothetical protein|nr:hypothetical protein [Arcobacter sp.]
MKKDLNFYRNLFIVIVIFSVMGIFYLRYEDNQFFNNPLSKEVLYKIDKKAFEIQKFILQKYKQKIIIPIIPTNKIPDNLYGLTTMNTHGDIKILLNKNRFKENEEYMIDYVLPHEYAHAMMFYFGKFTEVNGGHTKLWQDFCLAIGGKKCERFVNYNDILLQKVR